MSSTPARPRHGGNRLWAAQLGNCSPDQLLDFSASLNPLGPPASVLQALQAAIHSTPPWSIATYPDPHSTELRQALSQILPCDPEWILVGNGAAELLTWAARDCQGMTGAVLPVPAFSDYFRALAAAQVPIRSVKLPCERDLEWPPLADLLRPALETWPRPRALWLNHPHNPTGQIWPLPQVLACLPWFDLVVADEAFMDFLPDQEGAATSASLLPWVSQFPQLVVIRSLTKLYTLAGLRIGFAVAHPSRLQRWQSWRDPWSVNGLAQVAALAALQDQEFLERTRAWLPQARQHLLNGLQQLPGVEPWPSVANFLLVDWPISVPWVQQVLLRRHQILIRDCLSFPELGDRFCRLSVRTIPEQERLLAACRQILKEAMHSPFPSPETYVS